MSKEPTYEELLMQVSVLKNQVKYLSEHNERVEKQNEKLTETKKQLSKENTQLIAEIKQLTIDYNWALEQLKLSKKKIYGASAEKIAADYGQISFFNEAEAERTPMLPEPKIEDVVRKSHKKKKRSTKEIYKNLEVVEKIYELPKEEQVCPKCDSEMTFMRWEIKNEIKIIPAQAQLIVHKKAVYVCKNCDKNGIEGSFKTAEATPSLIEKSLVSPSLMAWIMNQKFCLALPLYRQEQELKRMGINLSRQNMSNWMLTGARLLKPLYDALRQNLVSRNILHADETVLEVLKLSDRDKPLDAYMWVYRTSRYEEHPIVLYDYEEGRSGDYAVDFLKGFSGYLHCDGWGGYNKLEHIKRVGCLVHLRRYFLNALEVQEDKKDYSTDAGKGFLLIEKIFKAERVNPDKPSEKTKYTEAEIAEIRKTVQPQLLKDFFDFCEEYQGRGLPKSLTGTAVNHALNQKETFMTFLDNPKLELSNNAAERAVKPFVIGRKNFLFCNTPNGANSSAVIYSIIETAKENGLKPFEYLEFLFENIRVGNDVAELVPWSERIPENLRLK